MPITNDNVAEPVKNFTSSATLLTTDVPGVRLAPDMCIVSIVDDDSKNKSYSIKNYVRDQ